MFLVEKVHNLSGISKDSVWTALCTYLVDISGHLNALNKSLEEKGNVLSLWVKSSKHFVSS